MGEYAAIAAATATSCAGTIAEITRVRPQMKRQARGVDRLSGASLGRLVVGVIVPAIVLLPAHRTISRRDYSSREPHELCELDIDIMSVLIHGDPLHGAARRRREGGRGRRVS